MARIDHNRSLPQPYEPLPPPMPGSPVEQMIRATWDELHRIALAFSDMDRPLSLGVHGADTIGVASSASYSTLLDSAAVVDWQQPGAAFNPATGLWTCPQEGLYLINAALVSNPFAAPATKSYQVLIRLTKTPLVGAPVVYTFGGGGLDDQFVTASASLLLPLAQGDTLGLAGAGVHATKTGTNAVNAYLNTVRQSGVGNAN